MISDKVVKAINTIGCNTAWALFVANLLFEEYLEDFVHAYWDTDEYEIFIADFKQWLNDKYEDEDYDDFE